MKYILKTTYLFLLINFASFAQEKKCIDFKIGKFIYSKPEYKRFKVTRTETTQIEIDSVTGIVLEGAIEWKTECAYELTYTKISNQNMSSMIGQKLKSEIIKISGNNIICKIEGVGMELELEMTKVDSK